jgi:hypothetical protein
MVGTVPPSTMHSVPVIKAARRSEKGDELRHFAWSGWAAYQE